MKITDLLRSLADKLDTIENGSDQANLAEPKDFAQPEQDNDDTDSVMIPPLQQKIELLKKGVGVASAFDQDGNGVPDELDAIKKNAGVNPAVIHIASDDEPLDA
jgi:hypothetical protein